MVRISSSIFSTELTIVLIVESKGEFCEIKDSGLYTTKRFFFLKKTCHTRGGLEGRGRMFGKGMGRPGENSTQGLIYEF